MTSLSKKLKIQPNQHIAIINPPSGYEAQLGSIPRHIVHTAKREASPDFLHIFVRALSELEYHASKLHALTNRDTILWISYPKTSSREKSDLNRNTCWNVMKNAGYRAITQVSIDEVWSALRFKPASQVVVRNPDIPGIDVKNRSVTPPADLRSAFLKHKKAAAFFDQLAFTHKKEYVVWIESAKKTETRLARIRKTMQMLSAQTKHP
jgi:hypothetical protein